MHEFWKRALIPAGLGVVAALTFGLARARTRSRTSPRSWPR